MQDVVFVPWTFLELIPLVRKPPRGAVAPHARTEGGVTMVASRKRLPSEAVRWNRLPIQTPISTPDKMDLTLQVLVIARGQLARALHTCQDSPWPAGGPPPVPA